MRKTMKRFSAFFLSMLLCLSMTAIPVFAASTSQDGLEITLVTNKESYTQKEEIQATLSVKNTNDFAVTNVSLENIIPKGYKLADNYVPAKQMDTLEAGKTTAVEVTYVTDPSYNPNEENTHSENNSENGSNNNQGPSAGNNGSNAEQNPSAGNNDSGDKQGPTTGDNSKIALWMIIMVVSTVCVIFVVLKNKKHGKKLLSFILFFTMVGTSVMAVPSVAEAAGNQKKNIAISEKIKVGDSDLEISAIVKYDAKEGAEDTKPEKPVRPENLTEKEKYYWDNSEVLDVIEAQKSKDVLTEAEAIALLKERGFDEFPVTYAFLMDGEFVDEVEAVKTSKEKHPIYQTFYLSKKGEAFAIFIVNGAISVNPVSFNMESNLKSELLIAESEELTSYINEVKKFYVTIPKDSAAIVNVVEKINAETLDKLTIEEINKLY